MRHVSLMILALLLTFANARRGVCQQSNAGAARGVIAYVREGKDIRLIAPDDTNDRRLWSHPRPDLAENQGIRSLAWHPGGTELAFSSGHEARAEFARLPKGTVSVTVHNDAGNVLHEQATGLFIIYVVGAPEPQSDCPARTLSDSNVYKRR